MGHGLLCQDASGVETFNTDKGSVPIIHASYDVTFSVSGSQTFTITGFNHTLIGNVAIVSSSSALSNAIMIAYPSSNQVTLTAAAGVTCKLLVLIA